MNYASEDIKDMLEAESSFGLTFGAGGNLFVGKEPSTPNNCVTILDTPSSPPDLNLDKEERLYNSSVQIRIRDKSYTEGMDLARNIMESLHGRGQETWNGTLYTVIHAMGEPAPMMWDENNRIVILINFNMKRR